LPEPDDTLGPAPALVDFGLGPYVHGVASRRFPVYTRGNAGEVYPQPVFPLSAGLATSFGGDPARDLLSATGMLTAAECGEAGDVFMGVFGGYMYLNLSVPRVLAIRTPGTTPLEADATFLGSESLAPPHVASRGDSNLLATLRGLRYGWRVLTATDLPDLDAGIREVDRWRATLPDVATATDEELAAAAVEALPMLSRLFTVHLAITGGSGIGLDVLRQFCRRRLGDPSRALALLGGLGGVDSADPSFALWDLSRIVRSDPRLGALFDGGVPGLVDRLTIASSAEAFLSAFDGFLATYGARGPNEWEMACEVWGTDPSLPLAIIDRMRHAGEDHDPGARSAARAAEREAATADVRHRIRPGERWLFDRALRCAVLNTRGRERCKTLLVGAIHDGRLRMRELGLRLAARTDEGRPDDLWYVTLEEFADYRRDPGAFTEVVAQRRAVRDRLLELEPPFTFDGVLPPVGTWRRRDAPGGPPAAVGSVLTGLAGCPGVVRGRARIVVDPSDPGDLGPGDVLVAPLTDPSWTPLFVPVEAVVVDVGGQMSHAVIVSRELGLPCIVAVTGATTSIPDGALVEVDGSAGTVTLLEGP
jgi:pyruvate,water dikinase